MELPSDLLIGRVDVLRRVPPDPVSSQLISNSQDDCKQNHAYLQSPECESVCISAEQESGNCGEHVYLSVHERRWPYLLGPQTQPTQDSPKSSSPDQEPWKAQQAIVDTVFHVERKMPGGPKLSRSGGWHDSGQMPSARVTGNLASQTPLQS